MLWPVHVTKRSFSSELYPYVNTQVCEGRFAISATISTLQYSRLLRYFGYKAVF